MAHVAKYPRSAIGHMLAHYDRSKSGLGDHIDPARTGLNYNLAAHQTLPQLDFLQKRLQEVRCRNQKDVNVLCDWIVTAPKDLSAEEHDDFFRSVYRYLEDKYGKDNVISAYVHKDETQPHMHFAFIPVTLDRKRGDLKVSAKEVITRADLKKFHPDLQRHVEHDLGHHVSILNGATEKGNRSIAELKRESATEKLEQVRASVDSIRTAYNALKDIIAAIEQSVQQEPRHDAEYRRRGLLSPPEKVIVLSEYEYLQMQHLVDAAVKILEALKDFDNLLPHARDFSRELGK